MHPTSPPNGVGPGGMYYEEFGRFYGTFRRGEYLFPCDEVSATAVEI